MRAHRTRAPATRAQATRAQATRAQATRAQATRRTGTPGARGAGADASDPGHLGCRRLGCGRLGRRRLGRGRLGRGRLGRGRLGRGRLAPRGRSGRIVHRRGGATPAAGAAWLHDARRADGPVAGRTGGADERRRGRRPRHLVALAHAPARSRAHRTAPRGRVGAHPAPGEEARHREDHAGRHEREPADAVRPPAVRHERPVPQRPLLIGGGVREHVDHGDALLRARERPRAGVVLEGAPGIRSERVVHAGHGVELGSLGSRDRRHRHERGAVDRHVDALVRPGGRVVAFARLHHVGVVSREAQGDLPSRAGRHPQAWTGEQPLGAAGRRVEVDVDHRVREAVLEVYGIVHGAERHPHGQPVGVGELDLREVEVGEIGVDRGRGRRQAAVAHRVAAGVSQQQRSESQHEGVDHVIHPFRRCEARRLASSSSHPASLTLSC